MAPDSDSSPCETTPIDFLLRRSPSLIHHADLWYQLGRNGTRTISPPVRTERETRIDAMALSALRRKSVIILQYRFISFFFGPEKKRLLSDPIS
jgi:hypothetical protein